MSDTSSSARTRMMLDEIAAYSEAMLAAGDSFDGCGGLEDYESPAAWLQHVRDKESPETCPPHLVTATIYAAVRKTDYGMVCVLDLRHRLNDFLAEYGGHIGYSVRPDERRKGYAKQMLALALAKAKECGINPVLVTCDEKNAASARTILANGGVFERNAWLEKQTVGRYWINA